MSSFGGWSPSTSRQYQQKEMSEAFSPMLPDASVFDSKGSSLFGEIPAMKHEAGTRFAGDAMKNIGELKGAKMMADAQIEAAETMAEAQADAAKARANASSTGSMIGGVAKVATGLFGLLCDMRLKHDIAPLQVTEVDDRLARAAFQVQKIREHC